MKIVYDWFPSCFPCIMKQKLGNRKAAEHEIRPLQFTWKNTEEKKNSYKIIFYILTEVQLGAFSFCFFFLLCSCSICTVTRTSSTRFCSDTHCNFQNHVFTDYNFQSDFTVQPVMCPSAVMRTGTFAQEANQAVKLRGTLWSPPCPQAWSSCFLHQPFPCFFLQGFDWSWLK